MNRKRTNFLKKHLPKKSIICEVGVSSGMNAKRILKYCEPSKLYLVDPWAGNKQKHYDNLLIECKENLKEFDESTYEIIRETSEEASKKFHDNFFDVVYIDALHQYENVKEDIEFWYPKIKNGGILAGHDCQNENGVRRAVHELCLEKELSLLAIAQDESSGEDSVTDFIIKVANEKI